MAHVTSQLVGAIWIVSPQGLVWSRVFDEVALSLQSAFAELGLEVPIVRSAADIRGTPLVLGANLAPMHGMELPADSIIYNLEQVHEASRWFAKDYGYVELLKRHMVWDFSRRNIQALEAMGVEPVVHCPVGYAPCLTRVKPAKQDVDVMFIGGGHPRRQKVLDEIQARGARLKVVYKVFGQERDDWMARGKIHLNMHKEPAELFEIVRVSYLLANHCFVVSERGNDPEIESLLEGGLVFSPYDKLVQTCLEYLLKPKERRAIAEAGFEAIRALSQKEFVQRAMDEHAMLHRKKRLHVTASDKDSIFVAIASYRDPEINATLRDMLRRADAPGRIRVGVCLQTEAADLDCQVQEAEYAGQVHVTQVDHHKSQGANWARSLALAHMQNEDYVLLIDSHMRFETGWDTKLLGMLSRCPAEKPVISAYLPNYDPPERRFVHPGEILRVRVKGLANAGQAQLVHVTGQLVPEKDENRGGLYPTPFCVANFIFGPRSMIHEVPIDPHIHFWGDEINYSVRLWTHGYDVFQPDGLLAYHHWVRRDQFDRHAYRRHNTKESKASRERLLALLGMEGASPHISLGEFGLGTERELFDFWAFAGIDWHKRDFTDFADKGIWNMAAREKGRVKNKKSGGLPRIFVQIASYRDPECQWTVKDLFEKAAHPERVFVGICWQHVKAEDGYCFQQPAPRPEQVRVFEVEATQSKGACWARSQVQKLWRGEEYTLQIDSHMRFEQGWDTLLLECLAACEDENAVLTCYPEGYTPPNDISRNWVYGMAAKEFDKHGILLMHGRPAYPASKPLPEKPMPGAYISANMIFGPSRIIEAVPYDPHLYFFGEEISLAVRLWTHGYNIYHPNRLITYHYWDRSKRRTHFDDHSQWPKQNEKAFARVRHLLGTEQSRDLEVLAELDSFGLGSRRSLSEYQEYSGIDFSRKTIAPHALEGVYERYDVFAASRSKPASKVISISLASTTSTKPKQDSVKTPRIFVNIASYRDPECQWTVKDMFEKASKPDRIFAGICWQFDEKEDQHCFQVSTRPEQVRINPVDWREAGGVCWARHQAQQLWEDEEYTLMIDSHMRFLPGWDEMMLDELARCPSEKALLSASPMRYTPPDNLSDRMNPTIRRAKVFQADGNVRCQGEMLDRSPEAPLRGAFLVANCIFSRSEITPEVPYDPYLYFDQEEIMYAAKLYTHGWDIYHPTRQFMYHYYNDHKAPGGSVRPLHWRDLHQADEARIRRLRDRGLARMNHLTGFAASHDSDVTRELDRYGFGRERSLAEFEAFSGIDFKRKVATERALRCHFIPSLHLYRDRPIVVPELDEEPKTPQLARAPRAVVAGAQAAALKRPEVMPVDVPKVAPAAAVKLLEAGDFMPLFMMHDSERHMLALETLGGKHTVVAYLPAAQPEFSARFCQAILEKKKTAQLDDQLWLVVMMDDAPERVQRFKELHKLSFPLYPDPDRRFGRSLGICRQGEAVRATGFALDNNLKVIQAHQSHDAEGLAGLLITDVAVDIGRQRARFAEPRVISHAAPALIIPQVLTPEQCAHCIQQFKNGHTFDGTVGTGKDRTYREDVKVRTDFIVRGELADFLDDKFSRSFFPEVKKVFGFDVLYRETYKIGLYRGEKQGFFRQHRDNMDPQMAYRRVAATVHLNSDYLGGGLRFPEYGNDIYRPEAGAAVAFSASNVHEALPVTEGERYVVVAFLHGREEEAYRRHYLMSKREATKADEYLPKLRQFPELKQARWFYKEWQDKNVRFDGTAALIMPKEPPLGLAANVNEPERRQATASGVLIQMREGHKPRKVFESAAGIIYDDFLPEDVYQKLTHWATTTDYEYINIKGKIQRAWHVHDGFPLRSTSNVFYHAFPPEQKPDYAYPSGLAVDAFIESLLAIQPEVEHLVGRQRDDWLHFSVTSWLYPQGTSLAMHDDGSGVYTGAYVFFMNQEWRAHWGGLLILMDEEASRRVHDYRDKNDQIEFYRKKFLHAGGLDELLLEHGMGKCIFPKRNRIVFIANHAYHMVTKVNEQAGDHVRMSLAGFFNRNK